MGLEEKVELKEDYNIPEEVDYSSNEENFVENVGKWNNMILKKKKDTITIEIPHNIIQWLAPTTARYYLSSTE